jgi:integrase/recombinase XerD
MRFGEVLTLDRSDADLEGGVLLVRESKFGKSRIVPIHEGTVAALGKYGRVRESFYWQAGNDSFFLSLTGRRVIYVSVFEVFEGCAQTPDSAPAGYRHLESTTCATPLPCR